MERSKFYEFVMENCKNFEQFKMTFKKKNGEIRKAVCKLNDKEFDNKFVTGNGLNRNQKYNSWNAFQYFDIEKHCYRTAKIENIIDVTFNNVTTQII